MVKYDLLANYEGGDSDPAKQSAIELADLALEIIDQLRTESRNEVSQIFWTEKVVPFFDQLILFYADNHTQHPELINKAFIAIEKSKAFALTQAQRGISALELGGVPPETLEKERQFKSEISEIQKYIFSEEKLCDLADVNKIDVWAQRLQQLQIAYSAFIRQLEIDYPDYFNLRFNTEVVDLDSAQNLLQVNELGLQYYLGEQQACVIFFDIKGSSIHLLNPAQINRACTHFLDQLYSTQTAINDPGKSKETYVQIANDLRTSILPGDQFDNNINQLTIYADGMLHLIPFGALTSKGVVPDSAGWNDLPYLIHEVSLANHLSATMHSLNLKTNESMGKYLGMTPSYQGAMLPNNLSALRHNQNEVTTTHQVLGGSAWLETIVRSNNSRVSPMSMALCISPCMPCSIMNLRSTRVFCLRANQTQRGLNGSLQEKSTRWI